MDETRETELRTLRRKGFLHVLKIIAIILILLAVLAFSVFLFFPKTFNIDRITRFFRYLGLKNKESYGTITFEADASNTYAALGDCLLVSSEGGAVLYDMEGTQTAFLQASLPTPVLCTSPDYCICFSPGGGNILLIDDSGKQISLPAMNSILDADVSSDGYIACVHTKDGYKSAATVYNRSRKAMFSLSSRTRYLNACAVSEDGDWLAVSALAEEEGLYHSVVMLLRTDTNIPDLDAASSSVIRVDIGSDFIYDMKFVDAAHLCIIGEENVMFLDTKGQLTTPDCFDGMQLQDYAFSEEGFCAFSLKSTVSVRENTLLVLDENGTELGRLTSETAFRDISARDEYVALLSEKELQIFDRKLKLYYHTADIKAANEVCARDDGTALLIGYNSASLYIP